MTAGTGDIVTGGPGRDTVMLGRWIGGDAASITDFDPAEDRLVVLLRPEDGTDPHLELRHDPDRPGLVHVLLNGAPLASLGGAAGLSAGDVALLAQQLPDG